MTDVKSLKTVKQEGKRQFGTPRPDRSQQKDISVKTKVQGLLLGDLAARGRP